MIYNLPIFNGREYTSAEWLRAMIELEVEGYAPNEMLSVVSVQVLPLVPPGASGEVAVPHDRSLSADGSMEDLAESGAVA